MVTNILIAVIVIHLIVGFGWLMYKLSSSDDLIDGSEDIEEKNSRWIKKDR